MSRRRLSMLFSLLVAACSGNQPPKIQPIEDQNASVGNELTIEIRANDPEGARIQFSFNAPDLPDLKTRALPATLSSFSDGVAIFRWTPQSDDRSTDSYGIDFIASDGSSSASETVRITVKDQGGAGSPVFRTPLGTGTTLDLSKDPCVTVPILVEDTDSTEVTIAEEMPLIAGATLSQTGPFEAQWQWCPSAEQIAGTSNYMLRLSADDASNPKTIKTYLIVLRTPCKTPAPGDPPAITHTAPAAMQTVLDVVITATITDDLGIKVEPLLYYSTTAPSSPVDLAQMQFVPMMRQSGDPLSGTYTGAIPNPVASDPMGTMKTLYYVIVATDNDDAVSVCDHSAQSPDTGTYAVVITKGGNETPLDVCAPCSNDVQCGSATDNCVPIGGSNFCSRLCGGASPNCPDGYHCSTNPVMSVNGASSRQCIPVSGTCAPSTTCTDDAYEENDTRTSIAAMSDPLTGLSFPSLMMCPMAAGGEDEDWYGIPISTDTTITATLNFTAGTNAADIDLEMYENMSTTVVDGSYEFGSVESVTHCFAGASQKVMLRAFTFDNTVKATPYSLTISKAEGPCACTDAEEPNNDFATLASLAKPNDSFTNLKICAGDEDWFAVNLIEGDHIEADVVGAMSGAANDIDIYFYKARANGSGSDNLTPCPPCDLANGQSGGATEHFEKTIGSAASGQGAGTYFIVIKGYQNATNTYTLNTAVTHP